MLPLTSPRHRHPTPSPVFKPTVVTPAQAAPGVAEIDNHVGSTTTILLDDPHADRKRQRRKESEREWYLKHREDRLAKQRDYDARNRERRLQQMKDYRTKHKEKQRAYKQEWYRRNRDTIKLKRTQRKGDDIDNKPPSTPPPLQPEQRTPTGEAAASMLLSLLCDVALMA
ncbi:hypothetical protein DYB32_000059 [Aphanomyces invadans]|uniref:Uncharacterized protein n=1 Tax=Aphanomyces invadans TaxID=157072 RepID=A0A3R6WUL1_9STRA|nr:hypothetical protein DYB32_000059 [Aphanomyces invadans]